MSHVLILDGSLTVRMDLDAAFTHAGWQTVLCGTIEAARDALDRRPCDVMILDALLPDGDGIEFLRQLKSSPATACLPVMLLSTEAEVAHRIGGLPMGADGYVGKPYDRAYVVGQARRLAAGDRGAAPHASSPIVLVIDDSETFLREIERSLADAGYMPVVATTGEEGLRVAAQVRPDAAIIDGVLPGIDGATVAQRLKSDEVLRTTRCLLLTASRNILDELRSLEAGVDGFARKDEGLPVILARLAAMLRPAETPEGSSRPEVESLFGPKTILAIDDSTTYLEALAEQLRQENYDVVLAHSGHEALELLKIRTVDCILLGVVLPGMAGEEVCGRIKASPASRDIPVVILTERADRETMIAHFNAGADDVVPKSSGFAVLRARLRAQFRRRQFEEESRRLHDQLHRQEIERAEAGAARELAETRAALLADLERKNAELEETHRGMLALFRELDERARTLQRIGEFKTRLVSYVSHEFRTPVGSLLSLARLLLDAQEPPLSPEQIKQVSYIQRAAGSLGEMVEDLLDMARLEAGKLVVEPSTFRVRELFGALRGLFRPLLLGKPNVALVFEDPGDAVELHTDESKLSQILRNFVSNAMKFTESGEIRVAAREDGDMVVFSVADTGIGIASEDQQRIFEEFAQVDHPLQRTQKGTGLGLFLSRRLADALGGSLCVTSRPGAGSTFFAAIPRRYQDVSDASPTTPSPPAKNEVMPIGGAADSPSAITPSDVLIIDDDEISRYILLDRLAPLDLHVAEAGAGQEGLEWARASSPRLIFLDLDLPDLPGTAVLEQLNRDEETRGIPVAIYTSRSLSREERESLLERCVAIIDKRDVGMADEDQVGAVLARHLPGPVKE